MSKPDLSTYGGALREIGYAGGNPDLNNCDDISLLNNQAVAIQFGSAVARDAGGQCKAPAADGDKIIGIATRFGSVHAAPGYGQTNANVVSYAQNDEVSIRISGDIYVVAAENVTADDQALSLTAGNGTIGGVTGGAAGAGRIVIPGARWLTTVAAGAVGVVRINN